MSLFDPSPTYRAALPGENAGFALAQPLAWYRNLGEQFQSGAIESFGLGTVIRDLATPRGVPGQTSNPLELGLEANPITGGIVAGYEVARNLGVIGTPTTGTPMSEDQWKASPFFRTEIPYDPAMTSDRAAALATQFDVRQARMYFGAKDMATTLLGNFVGGAFDPINYVPIFGQAARIAAGARFGYVVGHALIGASEAAINTAVFGALTAPTRRQYGDDVGWQAAINNIAFSALAGGIFGGIGGALGKAASARALKADMATRFATETVGNVADARGVLNDAVTSLVTDGDVRLSQSSANVLQRIANEVVDRRQAARALDEETAGVTGTKAGEVVITPSGARVAVRPEVVDLATLQQATGALQVRNRSANSAASAAQIEDIAINLDPVRLMPNTDASQGAPLVGPDNVVDSGNGRVAALNRAYDAYPDKAAAYKAAISAEHPEAAGMQRPVLIQRRLTPLSPEARAQFNADANNSSTARMSAVELAAMDRGALTDYVLAQMDHEKPVMAATNRPFVASFLANLPQNERNALVTPEGALNADGQRRIENALVAAAYGDVDATALRKFAEATDDNTRSIVGALADLAPRWVNMRRAVARGEISPEYDMTPELSEALRKLSGWRDQAASEKRPVGTVIKEGLGQGDILSGELAAPTKLFVRMFYETDDFNRAASRETISGRLNDLVDAVMHQGQPDLLGEAYAATKLGVLKGALRDFRTNIFETAGLSGRDGAIGEAGAQSGIGENLGGDRAGVGADAGGRPASESAARAELFRPRPAAIRFDGKVYTGGGKSHADLLSDAIFDNGRLKEGDPEALARAAQLDDLANLSDFGHTLDGRFTTTAELKRLRDAALAQDTGGGSPAEAVATTADLGSAREQLSAPRSVGEAIVDMQEPRDEPPIPGLDEAAQRVGKLQDNKALADQFGVDENGTFAEQSDIDALRAEGRLTPADEELLAAAEEVKNNGDAYSEALRAAANCVTR